jgi:hypothetical protein
MRPALRDTRVLTLAALLAALAVPGAVVTPAALAQVAETPPAAEPQAPPRPRSAIVGNVVIGADGSRAASIFDAGNDFAGIAGINQEAGSLNSQANAVALAVATQDGSLAFAMVGAQPAAISGNRVTDGGAAQSNSMTNAFNGSSGLVQVNQTSGMLNAQTNIAAIAFGGSGGAITLTDEALMLAAPPPTDNEVSMAEATRPRTNVLENSFSDFSGVAQVNQTTGNLNRVTNVVTFTGASFR